MTSINPHTTRATGTVLTAAIYNFDHQNHVANATALNAGKIEGATPPTVVGHVAKWGDTSGTVLVDGGAPSVGDVVGPASSVADRLALFNGTTGKLIKDAGVGLADVGAGKQSRWIAADTMFTSGSPSPGSLNVGGANVAYLAFDPTTAEFAFFSLAMPKGWNEGTLSAKVYWTHPATATNFGVSWFVGGGAFGDNDPIANVYAGLDITDTGGVTSRLYITSETGAIDPGNTQAEGDLLLMTVSRDPTAGADNLAVDAYLIGVMIHYTTNANTDA